eukprot:scaffold90908_cov21-Phaeocystis_antarctica.AAC.1
MYPRRASGDNKAQTPIRVRTRVRDRVRARAWLGLGLEGSRSRCGDDASSDGASGGRLGGARCAAAPLQVAAAYGGQGQA